MITHTLAPAFGGEKFHVARRTHQRATAFALLQRVECWLDRRVQRRALGGLGSEALKDIGLSRADAEREGGKPFWRA